MPPGYRQTSSVQHRGTCTTSPALQLGRISAYALPTSARDCRRHPTGAMQLIEPPGSVVPRVGRCTGGCPLLRHCAGHCGPRRRRRIMDAQKVKPVAHHSCFSAEHPVGSAEGGFCAKRPLASRSHSKGRSLCPYHCAGGRASVLPACSGSFPPRFREDLSSR